jgi:hypothetical protein
MLTMSWNQIGDYWMDQQMIAKAAQHYAQAKNTEKLIECYAQLEDYGALEKLIPQLTDGSPLLTVIGKKFMSVGMSAEAVGAFVKGGDLQNAIESCVAQHQWEVHDDETQPQRPWPRLLLAASVALTISISDSSPSLVLDRRLAGGAHARRVACLPRPAEDPLAVRGQLARAEQAAARRRALPQGQPCVTLTLTSP